MEKSTEILNELQSVSPLVASVPKVNVLQVPDGYFDDLDKKILTTVLLGQYDKKGNSDVPAGYFDTLSSRILARIKNENTEETETESETLSPLLLSLKDKNVFTVPAHYFENLSNQIRDRVVKSKKEGKVVSFGAKKQWWKYAAAAIVTGTIFIASLQLFYHNRPANNQGIITASSKMPDYIQMSFQYKTPEQLDQGIASLTDDEIVAYLEKNGSIMDNDLLTTGTDTGEMPAPDDYLIDENTLNNYLNMIDAQSADKNTQ
jgi:hypothetical protein